MADDAAECYYLSISIFYTGEKLNFSCVLQQNTLVWRVLLFVKGCDAGTVTFGAAGETSALTLGLQLKDSVAENVNVVYIVACICTSK